MARLAPGSKRNDQNFSQKTVPKINTKINRKTKKNNFFKRNKDKRGSLQKNISRDVRQFYRRAIHELRQQRPNTPMMKLSAFKKFLKGVYS